MLEVPNDPVIYLASQSPRRRELLAQIGVPHQVLNVNVVEVPQFDEGPQQYVERLACEKASAGLTMMQMTGLPSRPVLGADTVVVSNGNILEKPTDEAHAALMLRMLSGSTHQVLTAVAVADGAVVSVRTSTTQVSFRHVQDNEIAAYWRTGEPQDKAGGYAIQGLGAVFISELRGSYSGVVGLPIEQVVVLLEEFKVDWWQ